MRIDWQNDPNTPNRCRVIDLDTGRQILFCRMADEETGEYEHYAREDNKFVLDPETKRLKVVRGKARLRIDMLKPGEPYLLEQA